MIARHLSRSSAVAIAASLLAFLAVLVSATPAFAGGTVSDCSNDTEFSNKLVGGGTVDFSCGTETIVLSSTKTITADTTIDGGGTITLSGDFNKRLFVVNNSVRLTLQNITLADGYNSNSAGGGAVSNNGQLNLDHVTIQNMPDSGFNGGAIATLGALEISHGIFFNNKASAGGAIYASGSDAIVTIVNSDFHDNHATAQNGDGGAIHLVNGATLHMFATQVYSNTAVSTGGGLYIDHSAANLTGVTLSANHSGVGGAINGFFDTTRLVRVTIANNSADLVGGGIAHTAGGMTLINATLSNNSAGSGGGIYHDNGTAILNNVTLSGNSASSAGGGITNVSGSATQLFLKNVLVAKSKAGGNCDFRQEPDADNHDLSSDDTCHFGNGRDSVKLKLGPLETNGGATLTHRLLQGSAAIDKGVPVLNMTDDQRGVTRPQGTAFDVGAFEFVPCAGTPTKPQLLAPVANAQLTTQTVLLDWAGPDCVKKFSVVVRSDSKTGPIVFSKSKIKATQVTTTALAEHHKYFWWVTACNGTSCITSKWSKFEVSLN